MSARYGRRPYTRSGYACAEDLCDAFDDELQPVAEDGEEPPRPRVNRAVRLVDELTDGADVSARKPRREKASDGFHDEPESMDGTHCRESSSKPNRTTRITSVTDTDSNTVEATCPEELSLEEPAVLTIHPSGEGETVTVALMMPGEDGSPVRKKFRILVEQYAALGLRVGPISLACVDALQDASALCEAICKGAQLLQYGDRSARRLAYQLAIKGSSREVAEAAAEYLCDRGLIREDEAALRRAEQGVRKLWGPRRIRDDLRAGGFSADAVDAAMKSLGDVNFEENCAEAIRKKHRTLPGAGPADRAVRQKLIASICRMGYDTDTVRSALRAVLRED